MKPKKGNEGSVLKQDRLLVNLEIRVGLSQIIHFSDQKLISSTTHLVLQFFNLWFDGLETLRVLTN